MKLEPLLEPLSADHPCGNDLKSVKDPAFLGVFLASSGRLPREYVQRGGIGGSASDVTDKPLDPTSIDFRGEARQLDELMTRSRDLRFLALRAQWAALAGNLKEVVDAVAACASLLETFGDRVPPFGADDRKRALAGLNNNHTMVLPLQFYDLTEANSVTLRKVRVARDQATPLSFETDITVGPLLDALSGKPNEKAVARSFEEFTRLRDAITRLDAAAQASVEARVVPDFSRLVPTIEQVLSLIAETRSDLRARALVAAAEGDPAGDTASQAVSVLEHAPVSAAPVNLPDVKDHAHARRLLEACEAYYRGNEPSSAALLLVTQSRLLIGRPLLEAIETLLPEKIGSAAISFGPSGFALGIDRLRGLSSATPDVPQASENDEPDLSVAGPDEAKAVLLAVEQHFRRVERSSPIPMLLARARSYLDRDFQSIVDELIPSGG